MSDKCMTKGCYRFVSLIERRGLCLVCYSRAKKLVESGATTWEKLVDMGLAKKPEEGTVQETVDPFTDAFNKAKEREEFLGDGPHGDSI